MGDLKPPKGYVPKGTGARMRERRVKEGVTQKALAQRLGIASTELAALEHDRRSWSSALIADYIDGVFALRR